MIGTSSQYTTSDAALIDVPGGKVEMRGRNRFEWIKRRRGNGGVFELRVVDASQRMSGVTFAECTAENGGAISVTLSSGMKLSLEEGVSFESCSAQKGGGVYAVLEDDACMIEGDTCVFSSEDESIGSYMYIECGDAESVRSSGGFGSGWSYEVLRGYGEKVYVEEKNPVTHTQRLKGGLVYFMYGPMNEEEGGKMIVSVSGADIMSCGWSVCPCESIHAAVEGGGEKDGVVIEMKEGRYGCEGDVCYFNVAGILRGLGLEANI